MALLARVLKSMERIAPQSLADHAWDNVGLLVGTTSTRLFFFVQHLFKLERLKTLFFFAHSPNCDPIETSLY